MPWVKDKPMLVLSISIYKWLKLEKLSDQINNKIVSKVINSQTKSLTINKEEK